ncbi:phage holin family protein [Sandarakinorhabdus oryzae]|uniref:phage holin family protein n=1 Tax=Sandarakinorhabdus oryzae TaxID=2675220 RepID=UPI0012E0E778|nr:phage holin family protein [Sandarakinorhabdus oryzae]
MKLGSGLANQTRQMVGGFLLLMQNLSRLTAAELRANAGALRAPLIMLLAASGLMMTALTLLTVAGVLALAQLVGPVAACAIVAVLALLAGWALAQAGLSRLSAVDLAPRRSMATLQAQIDRFAARTKPPKDKTP